jgi:hypothetical protein
MASRAHVIYDYPSNDAFRPRHNVWLGNDDEPVVLPRRQSWDLNFTLVASALAAAALTLSATYALYGGSAPTLGPTDTAEVTPNWTPDSEPWRAALFERLIGRAQAVPSLGEIAVEPEHQVVPSEQAAPAEPELTGDEPSAASPSRPEAPAPAPYPNPTTTPPDIPAPGALPAPLAPTSPSPEQAPDNPY